MALSGPLLKINSEGLCQLTLARSFGPSGEFVSLSLETALIAHSLDTALQLLKLLCCLSAEVSIV